MSNSEQGTPRVKLQDWLKEGLGGEESVAGRDTAAPEVRVLHPLQRVGVMLALVVFSYIAVATSAIFFISFKYVQLPSFPQPPTLTGSIDNYKAAVDAYRQSTEIYQSLAKMQVDRALQLFQLIVASTILPAFTAILGYIFGSRKND